MASKGMYYKTLCNSVTNRCGGPLRVTQWLKFKITNGKKTHPYRTR